MVHACENERHVCREHHRSGIVLKSRHTHGVSARHIELRLLAHSGWIECGLEVEVVRKGRIVLGTGLRKAQNQPQRNDG